MKTCKDSEFQSSGNLRGGGNSPRRRRDSPRKTCPRLLSNFRMKYKYFPCKEFAVRPMWSFEPSCSFRARWCFKPAEFPKANYTRTPEIPLFILCTSTYLIQLAWFPIASHTRNTPQQACSWLPHRGLSNPVAELSDRRKASKAGRRSSPSVPFQNPEGCSRLV